MCVQTGSPKHGARITSHVLAQLSCLGNHTVTGLLNTCGRQFADWSADYRLYSKNRIDPEKLFEPVRQEPCEQPGPVVITLDDTRLPKVGRKTHGVKYMRDPMGPPSRVNFILAQRFLQTSMACKGQDGQARMIPVDWVHAPVTQKPKTQSRSNGRNSESRKKPAASVWTAARSCCARWMPAWASRRN